MFLTHKKNLVEIRCVLLFARVLAQEHLQGLLKIENRYFRGDGGIGVAPRLAVAHRGPDTNAPGGHLNQTPGEGVCVSHVAACAVLRLPAPSEAPPDALVPAKGRADGAAAWAHGAAGTRAPGSHLT